MSIRSPSNRLSVDFLTYLQANHYLSPSGAEYCGEEVDRLLVEKLETIAERSHVSDVADWVALIGAKRSVVPENVTCIPCIPEHLSTPPPIFLTLLINPSKWRQ